MHKLSCFYTKKALILNLHHVNSNIHYINLPYSLLHILLINHATAENPLFSLDHFNRALNALLHRISAKRWSTTAKKEKVLTTLSLNSICGLFSLRLFNRACFLFCLFLSTPWSIDDARWSSMRNDCYANLAVKDRSACLENGHLVENLHVFFLYCASHNRNLKRLEFFLTFLSALFK